MRILLLGATAGTGAHLLDLALQADDDVTVLVRDPARLGVRHRDHPGLRVLQGDATSPKDMTRAVQGQDAVAAALGTNRALISYGLFTRAAAALVSATESLGPPTAGTRATPSRVVWLSSFGVEPSAAAASPEQLAIYTGMLAQMYQDKAVADAAIRASATNWTVVLPTRLTDGPSTDSYRAAAQIPMVGDPSVSRADVAHFMYSAVRGDDWARTDVVLSS